jgi:hypothetical protein
MSREMRTFRRGSWRCARSAEALRAAKSERDLVASYLEPPIVLADLIRGAKGPDGTVDLEEHAAWMQGGKPPPIG